ncbi:MAG: hypothetical protein AB1505_33030, partial [Candidatus Latescibacterota bacterium]
DLVAYAGPNRPASEADLVRVAPVTEVGEWEELTLGAPSGGADSLWVAVGFSVVWETEQTYYLDEVTALPAGDGPTAAGSATWGKVKAQRGR